MNNQKGLSNILLLVIVTVIIGIGVYLYRMKDEQTLVTEFVSEVQERLNGGATTDFEGLEEPEGTPEEINNEALGELDTLMYEIDATTVGEDLSDLEF
jgi:hypothetical protein